MNEATNCTATVPISIDGAFHAIGPLIRNGNVLLLINAILMGVVVGIGTYAPRYRRHPFIGVLFLTATTLFLPIISNVAASVTSTQLLMRTIFSSDNPDVFCTQYEHIFLVFVWVGLVLMVGVTASVVVAGDAREGRNIGPPKELTGAAVWTTYLTISTLGNGTVTTVIVFGQLFLIMYTKLLFKYYAFYKAQRSFAHGRSPSLVYGYMDQLQQLGDTNDTPTILKEWEMEHHEHDSGLHPPALIVMGEDNVQAYNQPCGYRFKWIPEDGDKVVTLDRLWKLPDMEMLRSSVVQPKYLGFSFTLFKILRCRFAKYTVSSASFTKAQKFFRYTLIKGSGAGYERAFGVVVDELSFLHDYYNSSQPIYYSHHGLVILNLILSLYSIGYCMYLMVTNTVKVMVKGYHHSQVYCSDKCFDGIIEFDFLGRYSDVMPLYLVSIVLVLAEARDILFYICSNLTKVSIIYHYVNQASWQRSPFIKKCIGVVFKYCSSKRVNNWDDRIKQCSILDRPPRLIAHLPRCLQRLLNLPKKVKLPNAVKASIFEALKTKCLINEQEGSLMCVQRPPSPVPCDTDAELIDSGKCTAYTIMAWHIATTIFEVQHQQQPLDPECQHKVAATHLSRYCAYLVACYPDLLPDGNDEWCKSLYDNAKKDIARVLSMPQNSTATYPLLDASLLSAQSTHSVLKDGASLGKQLVDSGIGWELLARFWSEMILYVAPSENLEAHAEAVARGGELVTLVWAMLSHAGIDRK